MTSRERLLTALDGGQPDRLPVTTHHLMPWFLSTYMDGASEDEFFRKFGLDSVRWAYDWEPDPDRGEYWGPGDEGGPLNDDGGPGDSTAGPWIVSDSWRIEATELPGPGLGPGPGPGRKVRYDIETPGGALSMVMEYGPQTDWVLERPIKDKGQIELFHRYAPWGRCVVDVVNEKVLELGDRGILRGAVPGFEIYGQPGCWQDAVELFGVQELIMQTRDDPGWVRELLSLLRDRKRAAIGSMEGADFDLIELGGGSASSTVISPAIFQEFVAPYDADLIEAAHQVRKRVVYHTCGGMMPLLEMIADMGPDAMETFTPPALGGDTDLGEAKGRIGSRVCMIGGFDQHTFFRGCDPEDTRRAVRRCFQEAGSGGGFILAPSDHFFHADLELLEAFGQQGRACLYTS
ncbi:MAG: uroporphyrinogen decarboxylase family protein [Gemmatimonadota bacterium]|jgi:uroporphyrinogen-III decarboxylase